MSQPRIRQVDSTAELYAVSDIVHAAFEVRGPAWATRAQRLASARRATAQVWLLEDEGRGVSSLLSYPLSFGLPDGRVADGYGLGAVATLPDARCRGHAARLVQEVAAHNAERGRGIGLLFSAIPKGYYERLGYRALPAWDLVAGQLEQLADSGARAEWHPLAPRRCLETLAQLHARHHAGQLHLTRDAAQWLRSLELSPEDWWFGLDSADEPRGYARVAVRGKVLDVIELVIPDVEDAAPAIRALAAMSLELELEKLGAWVPPVAALDAWLEDRGRDHTLPMVTGYDGLTHSQFWSSDYF